MPKFYCEDIIGWCDDDHFYCEDCLPDDKDLKPIFIDQYDEDEIVIFCDCCGEQII
ncbi:MAG: hypothetical protein WCP18_00960 [bacterium]